MISFCKRTFLLSTLVATSTKVGHGFTPSAIRPSSSSVTTFLQKQNNAQHHHRQIHTKINMSSSTVDSLPEISSMRIGELKKELESYGISTKSFFEKSELVGALEKARAEGKTPISSPSGSTTSSTSSASSSSTSTSSNTTTTTTASRDERLAEEMEKCNAMKASELKSELKSYGIATNTFFEKSEFVKACAEARVDGASAKSGSNNDDDESYAEYANVEVLTSDDAGPRKRSQEGQEQQQGGGAGRNPFGGGGGMPGGNPFGGGMPGGMGGMGGMGDIGDMLKNMGMGGMGGGGAAGNPFGGGGGNPFGGAAGGNPFGGGGMPGGADQMKKAQEMMSNPKVREIMAKAQQNPKVMAAMTECMSNPAAFAKYQNDPEVGSLLKELQQFM